MPPCPFSEAAKIEERRSRRTGGQSRCRGEIAAATVIEICRPSIATAESSANPVYEAIDRHRAAAAAHLTAINELHRLESIYGGGCANWITEKPCRDENDAFDALVGAVASTREGLVAKLQYLQDINDSDEWGWVLDERQGTAIALIESFAASINNIWPPTRGG